MEAYREKTEIVDPDTNRSYFAVKIDEGFAAYQSSAHEHPVARIKTKSGDTV